MHATQRVSSILLFAIGFAKVASAALGINCQGSGLCPLASYERANSTSLLQGLRDGIWASTLPNSTTYNSDDHVICVSEGLPITVGITAGVSAPVPGSPTISTSLSSNGKIGDGGICVFPQDLKTPLTLGKIKELADALLEHSCNECGSVPVHYVDHSGMPDFNDPSDGILTFNYVNAPFCDKTCISAADGNEVPATTSSATTTATPAPTATGKSGSVRVASAEGWAFAEAAFLGLGALVFGLF